MKKHIIILAAVALLVVQNVAFSGEIPEDWIFSVVYIENVGRQGAGTGFLVGRLMEDDSYALFLISNKHVLMPPRPEPSGENSLEAKANLFFNKMENGQFSIAKEEVVLRDSSGNLFVKTHPNPQVDVAAFYVSPHIVENRRFKEGLKIGYIPEEQLATEEALKKEFISLGERVLILGFPSGLTRPENCLPLARGGILASYPFAPLFAGPFMLIDAAIISGSSGSPIFLPRQPYSFDSSGQIEPCKSRKPYLLGIIAKQGSSREAMDALGISDEIAGQISLLNLGLAFKAETIAETIDQFGFSLLVKKTGSPVEQESRLESPASAAN